MLVYQYPPKVDKTTMQMREFNASLERKKFKKDSLKNIVLGLVLFAISFFVPFVPVKILLCVFALFYIFLGYLIYNYANYINSPDMWTRVYDDRIEHSQVSTLTRRVYTTTVYFDDVESSHQTFMGELCFKLCDKPKSHCEIVKNGASAKKNIKNNEIALFFDDTEPKLFIINELYEKIKYPKKDYLEIVDEDEEDY